MRRMLPHALQCTASWSCRSRPQFGHSKRTRVGRNSTCASRKKSVRLRTWTKLHCGLVLSPESDPMSEMAMTSTGHALGDASWLDAHYESARAEYEDVVRFVGILPGWTVLDAGCGSGGYVPLIGELVGATGRVAALDLA